MPGLGGKFWKNCSRDSSPPADAPMPTTRNLTGSVSGCLDVETDSELTEVSSSFPSPQNSAPLRCVFFFSKHEAICSVAYLWTTKSSNPRTYSIWRRVKSRETVLPDLRGGRVLPLARQFFPVGVDRETLNFGRSMQ